MERSRAEEGESIGTHGPGRVRVALAQLACKSDSDENIDAALGSIGAAARRQADLCVLPELFTNRYVGQFEDVPAVRARLPDHRTLLKRFRKAAKDTSLALVLPFAETLGPKTCYNSLAIIDRRGTILGHYQKIHLPNSEGYREDLYFRPGDRGYLVLDLEKVRLGAAICWDQWFPEASRILALKGAQLIVYPSAIGSEVVKLEFDSRPSWELVMRAQAIMNRVFIAAVNRVGQEERIRFYGGSFFADPWGGVVRRASLTRPELVIADLDLSEIEEANRFFGFFDTRRPETYAALTRRTGSSARRRRGGKGQ